MSDLPEVPIKKALPTDKFHEIELGKIFDAILGLHTFRAQVITFLGTVDLGAMSFAFSTHKAMAMLLGGSFFLLAYFLDLVQMSVIVRFYYRALQLQVQFSPTERNTYLSLLFMDKLGEKLREIVALPNETERIMKVRKLAFANPLDASLWIVGVVGAMQIALGAVLWLGFNWPLF